jgi:hypothetical protein
MSTSTVYPARLSAHLDDGLSRWKWLFKWILAVPHYVILAFLWVAFLVAAVIAGFAILFTGRYPRTLFKFNVGILRWNWRVAFYSYSVLGTDRYPPFSLADTDYPATFDVAYPDQLSRWQVLVKPWLLALPHLLIVGALTTGIATTTAEGTAAGLSLLALLVLIAGIILLVSGRYRLGLFNLLMGLNRWIYRVAAYSALMTDSYPPFRLDQGASEAAAR